MYVPCLTIICIRVCFLCEILRTLKQEFHLSRDKDFYLPVSGMLVGDEIVSVDFAVWWN